MQIIPGLHKIEGTLGVNCYLIETPEGLLQVDTGLPGQYRKTLRYLDKIGKRPSDVKIIILTHGDIDHIGCAGDLKKATGAQLAIHNADLDFLEGRRHFKTTNTFLAPVVAWAMDRFHFQPAQADIILNSDWQFAGWQVVTTPGHTPGSISLYLRGKVIIVGDALRTSHRAVPRPISRRICLDLAQRRISMQKIAALDYQILLPGHGAPILTGAASKVQKMYDRFTRIKSR
jgi:glyoxylase-like metal-dependent hydrolase (beta-lactamase superfamily II)